MSDCCPFITCLLTDPHGTPVCPYAPNAVVYAAPRCLGKNRWSAAIEGYIAVFSGTERISPPIPFCIITSFCLSAPGGSFLTFQMKSFHAWAVTGPCRCGSEAGRIKLLISIETVVSSRQGAVFLVPEVDSELHIVDRVRIYAEQICDCATILSESCIFCQNSELRAEISQYNTIADGKKRTFQNTDELKRYGGCGILSPAEVSYYHVFVNGLLQPKKNYVLKKGELIFLTQDVPSKGQSVIILFVTWRDVNCRVTGAVEWQFSAISTGMQRVYTNGDELPEYKSPGIPSPSEVSLFNLYINGVLQPQTNYCIKKGILELTTKDIPVSGALLILECIVIRDFKGRLFHLENTAFNAYSNGGKIYTDRDKIRVYDSEGIHVSTGTSYQNLFINSVIQPHTNYFVQKGCLILTTKDNPTENAPITLQSVKNRSGVPCCDTHFSEAALAQWKKEFPHAEDPRGLFQRMEEHHSK